LPSVTIRASNASLFVVVTIRTVVCELAMARTRSEPDDECESWFASVMPRSAHDETNEDALSRGDGGSHAPAPVVTSPTGNQRPSIARVSTWVCDAWRARRAGTSGGRSGASQAKSGVAAAVPVEGATRDSDRRTGRRSGGTMRGALAASRTATKASSAVLGVSPIPDRVESEGHETSPTSLVGAEQLRGAVVLVAGCGRNSGGLALGQSAAADGVRRSAIGDRWLVAGGGS
jgi:hypothetical protein